MFVKTTRSSGELALIPALLLVAAFAVPSASSNADGADQEFVANASSGGMAEVKLGQLAVERSSNSEVQNFGRRMIADHSVAGKKLQATASKEGISVTNDLNVEDRTTYDRLSTLHGTDFDRAYAADMVKDHQKDIADFEKEAKYGKDPAVRQFAQETLPTLRQHLQLAEKMQRSMGATSSR